MSRSRAQWSTKLHEIINSERDDEWKAVMQRIQTHPHEAGVQGEHHLQTPLHAACLRYPPYEAVQALLKACPECASHQNKEGETTLHLAVEGSSEDVQLLILSAFPDSIMKQDKYGDTPCHRACALGACIEVLEKFVEANPEVIDVPNNDGITPFFMLSNSYEMAESIQDISEEGEFWDEWEKALLFLSASYFKSYSIPREKPFRILHAVAGAKCPRALVRTCVNLFSYQLLSLDEANRVPLSIAASTEVFSEPEKKEAPDTPSDTDEGSQEENNLSVLQIFLAAEPKAASIVDSEGKLPLTYAIENGIRWEEGLEDLLWAFPQALYLQDPKTSLYPFMLAGASKDSSVETIYSLLRAFPVLVQTGIQNHCCKRKCDESTGGKSNHKLKKR